MPRKILSSPVPPAAAASRPAAFLFFGPVAKIQLSIRPPGSQLAKGLSGTCSLSGLRNPIIDFGAPQCIPEGFPYVPGTGIRQLRKRPYPRKAQPILRGFADAAKEGQIVCGIGILLGFRFR